MNLIKIAIWLSLGYLGGMLAARKGYNPRLGILAGLVGGPVALMVGLIMPYTDQGLEQDRLERDLQDEAAEYMPLAMMLVHELGHVLAAWLTGGRIVYANLYPGQLPSTLVQPNPHPSIVLWAGLLGGWVLPIIVFLLSPGVFRRGAGCWAAFCLLAGGVYLAAGGGERLTDTGALLAEGWSHALLIATGGAVAAIGYGWSRQAWKHWLRMLAAAPPTRRSIAASWLALALQWRLAFAAEAAIGS